MTEMRFFLRMVKGCSQLEILCNEDVGLQSDLKVSPLFKKLMNLRIDGGKVVCIENDSIPQPAYFYALQDGCNAVSYTHLDVYKRQVNTCKITKLTQVYTEHFTTIHQLT